MACLANRAQHSPNAPLYCQKAIAVGSRAYCPTCVCLPQACVGLRLWAWCVYVGGLTFACLWLLDTSCVWAVHMVPSKLCSLWGAPNPNGSQRGRFTPCVKRLRRSTPTKNAGESPMRADTDGGREAPGSKRDSVGTMGTSVPTYMDLSQGLARSPQMAARIRGHCGILQVHRQHEW